MAVTTFDTALVQKLKKVLKDNSASSAGVVLNLAWSAGLKRSEIYALRWEQVDFDEKLLHLSDRDVPMERTLEDCLKQWNAMYGKYSPYVAVSENYHVQMAQSSISRMVQAALNKADIRNIGLVDLRHDYIYRQFSTLDQKQASSVTGLSITAYRQMCGDDKRACTSHRLVAESAAAPPPVTISPLHGLNNEALKPGEWAQLDEVTKDALVVLLEKNSCSIAGLVLRLAWRAGLMRNEIQSLQWDQVDFDKKLLHLTDRDVPICDDLERCLRQWRTLYGEYGPYVAVSEKFHRQLTPESISNLARITLRNAEIPNVRLADLHYNYILEQIKEYGWQQAMRNSGLSMDVFWRRKYKEAREEAGERDAKTPLPPNAEEVNEKRLHDILDSNRSTPAGIALWLAYYGGLQYKEITALTWQQIDWSKGVLRLADRDVTVSENVIKLLREYSKKRKRGDAAQVILSPHARKPIPLERLCKLIRELLVQGGLDNTLPKTLRLDAESVSEMMAE